MEKMNDTDDLFKYDLKSVEKIDEMRFKVNFESDLFVDLDNEWHVSFFFDRKNRIKQVKLFEIVNFFCVFFSIKKLKITRCHFNH